MAVGGDAGEWLGIPEERGDRHARVREDVGTIAPDEEGVAGLAIVEQPVTDQAAVAIEDGVSPILLLAGGQKDVARAEADDWDDQSEAGGENDGSPARARGRRPHQPASGGDREDG